MQSIKELYKIGRGPSSSHTLAPERACLLFNEEFGRQSSYEAELYGSLSLTGKGHCTDQIIQETLPGPCTVVFKRDWNESFPNGFYLHSFDADHNPTHTWTIFSLGGGSISIKEKPVHYNDEVYPESSYHEAAAFLKENQCSIPDYIHHYESDIDAYMKNVLQAMIDCVDRGLQTEGTLPGKLQLQRSAKQLMMQAEEADCENSQKLKLMAYAYAANEENAAGHSAVTAPTLGSCGVMASLMYYASRDLHIEDERLIESLLCGGLFGNLIKTNATISGAVGGCQAEVGTAVSMASAAFAYLNGSESDQIEYAAEIGMEHLLGLTCDPIGGYVMIPCIERNAMGILRAIDAAVLSQHMSRIKHHMISFDTVVKTMQQTGQMIPIQLKETSEGGLAKEYKDE